jgi:serine/threonine-protein kinase HipA
VSRLAVFLGDAKVAMLERFDDRYDTHRLTFERAYLDDPARPMLGQLLEDRFPGPYETHGMIPWFDHLLPLAHRPQRRAIAADAGIEADDDFAMLAWLGEDLPGAVRLRVEAEAAPALRSRASRPVREATPEAIYRASLPGVQWKLSLAEGFKGLTLPLKGEAGEWIAKFHTDAYERAVRREYATMAWAKASGLEVPEARIVRAEEIAQLPADVPRGDGEVYLIRRFDRAPGARRVHMEDFAQILGMSHGPGQFNGDYEEIARVLAAIAPPEDVRAFVRQLVFCVLCGNGDAHAKNWSVLYPDGRRARLSPAYDLTPTVLVADQQHGLALRLDGDRDFARITASSFDPIANLTSVVASTMRDWVLECARQTRTAWAHPIVREGFSVTDRARLEGHMASVRLG